jgi:hypothetical protein
VGGLGLGTGVGVGVPVLLVLLLQLEEQIIRQRQDATRNRIAGMILFKEFHLIVEDKSSGCPRNLFRAPSKLVENVLRPPAIWTNNQLFTPKNGFKINGPGKLPSVGVSSRIPGASLP